MMTDVRAHCLNKQSHWHTPDQRCGMVTAACRARACVVNPAIIRSRNAGQRALTSRSRQLTVCYARDNETAQEAQARRIRESAQVESRVTYITTMEEYREQLKAAGDKLVLVEVLSDEVCESGVGEQAELHWRADMQEAAAASHRACMHIKHTFQRTARECDNVTFLEFLLPDGPDGDALKQQLGVGLLPSLQFIRNGRVLWQEQGYEGMVQDMGEGVLYFGDSAANGVKATDHVKELRNRQDVHQFVNNPDKQMLTVLNVSTTICKPCMKVFPAVLALARNFTGHATFARLLADDIDEPDAIMKELGILEVPTFIFYRGGKETGRLVSSDRGDLIGTILQQQADAGIAPPPPPPRVAKAPVKKEKVKSSPASRWR